VKKNQCPKKQKGKNFYSSFTQAKFLLPFFVFALAFLVRFVYLNQIRSSLPFFSAPIMDEEYHDNWAKEIAGGDWIGKEPFFRAPLYIYLLASVYKIFGHGYFIPRFFQIILGSLSCVLVFLIAKKLFNQTVGIISGAVASFYAMLIFYDGELLLETLTIFLDLAVVYLLIHTHEKSSLKRWFVCGIVLGLSTIARPNVLIFIPFVLVWMWVAFKEKLHFKTFLLRWGILCLGILIFIFPVTLRNYLVGKDLVLISWQGGYNFYLGNNAEASGWSATAKQFDETWWGGYYDAIRLAEQETGQKLKPSQISNFWYKKGVDFILSQPLDWLKLMGRKILYFWKGYEIPNNVDMYFFREFSSLFNLLLGKVFIYLPFGLIGPLSLLGMAIGLKKWRNYLLIYLFILSYMASIVIFFVCSRFRMPVIPFLIIFASFSLWWLINKIEHKGKFSVAVFLIVLLILFFGLNTERAKVVGDQSLMDHFSLGTIYKDSGKLDLAIREYEITLQRYPNFAPAHNNLGNIYSDQGKTDLAIEEFNKAIQSDPTFDKSYFNLAIVYHRQGNLDTAIEYYSKAIKISPHFELAHLNLANVYYQKGLKEKAQEEWKKVLELNPNNLEVKRWLEQMK